MATIENIGREFSTVIKDTSRSLIGSQLDKLKAYVNEQADQDLAELGETRRGKSGIIEQPGRRGFPQAGGWRA